MSDDPFSADADIARCVSFANEIGIRASVSNHVWRNEFLPGILIWRGAVFINPANIIWYDHVLHEIGHLALLPSCIRKHATGDVEQSIRLPADRYCRTHPFMTGWHEDPVQRALMQAGDPEAIAWSFAAMEHLGLPIRITLAQASADEVAATLCMLGAGRHLGVHGLAATGMTTTKEFPKMRRWVQP